MDPKILKAAIGDSPGVASLYYGQDVLETLKQLPDQSVHMVATSPPYFNLRSYLPEGHPDKAREIGVEETPEEYVEKLVVVFREIWRVLHNSGVIWINIADSYVGGGGFSPNAPSNLAGSKQATQGGAKPGGVKPCGKLKPKDLVGIPWLVALALRDDGWYLRSDCIWHRINSMPESVSDRCTRTHEYIFMLTKKPKYFFDAEAIKEKTAAETRDPSTTGVTDFFGSNEDTSDSVDIDVTRNHRTIWSFYSRPYKGAHFATFCEELPETMIKAGSSSWGCCPRCLAPWKRVSGKPCEKCGAFVRTAAVKCPGCGHVRDWKKGRMAKEELLAGNFDSGSGKHVPRFPGNYKNNTVFGEWVPTCNCPAHEPVPCTVLDPFSGSGTTGRVALRLKRNYIGIDLNKEYEAMAVKRIDGVTEPEVSTDGILEQGTLVVFGASK